MAIKYIIEADSASELQQAFEDLFGDEAAPEAGEPAAPRTVRGRRKKDAVVAATAASGGQAASPEASPGSASGPTATSTASPSDLLGATSPPAVPANTDGITKEVVAAKMTAYIGATTPLKAQETLAAAGVRSLKPEEDGEFAKRLSTIHPDDYGKAAAAFDAALAVT